MSPGLAPNPSRPSTWPIVRSSFWMPALLGAPDSTNVVAATRPPLHRMARRLLALINCLRPAYRAVRKNHDEGRRFERLLYADSALFPHELLHVIRTARSPAGRAARFPAAERIDARPCAGR